jgi:hypothetical protein
MVAIQNAARKITRKVTRYFTLASHEPPGHEMRNRFKRSLRTS